MENIKTETEENSEHGVQGMEICVGGAMTGVSGAMTDADGMGITAPAVILVKPQLAENIGMAARAMKNCGLKEMRLVAPEQSPVSETALRASSNSEDILLNARVYATTREALADLDTVYAATAPGQRSFHCGICGNASAGGAAYRLYVRVRAHGAGERGHQPGGCDYRSAAQSGALLAQSGAGGADYRVRILQNDDCARGAAVYYQRRRSGKQGKAV